MSDAVRSFEDCSRRLLEFNPLRLSPGLTVAVAEIEAAITVAREETIYDLSSADMLLPVEPVGASMRYNEVMDCIAQDFQ